jgi:hypothetical protein
MKIELLSFLYSPCHLLQNDGLLWQDNNWWFERLLEVWECNAFSSTFITKRVHFLECES